MLVPGQHRRDDTPDGVVVVDHHGCAVVVRSGASPTLEDLCAHLLGKGLSERKVPERLVVVDDLPRNAMGKVAERKLRASLS